MRDHLHVPHQGQSCGPSIVQSCLSPGGREQGFACAGLFVFRTLSRWKASRLFIAPRRAEGNI